jgi:diguanylate cyclase (GGDEF)-like protein
VIVIAVDQLKAVNEKCGSAAGDLVMRVLGKLLKSAARPQDLAARYGPEEFCLVLPGTPKGLAAMIGESVRRAIAAKPVATGGRVVPVTSSVGVASFEPAGPFKDVGHLLRAADLAVDAAKKAGRNCVRVFTLRGNTAGKAA